mmetsp:Transcript_21317/g.49173  ORF Transcript_21317/g.49173 Transcript_21317/m.49173 type:complete len:90 (-) Transcript_21317:121-390(-)
MRGNNGPTGLGTGWTDGKSAASLTVSPETSAGMKQFSVIDVSETTRLICLSVVKAPTRGKVRFGSDMGALELRAPVFQPPPWPAINKEG